jgi:hypothetical protein
MQVAVRVHGRPNKTTDIIAASSTSTGAASALSLRSLAHSDRAPVKMEGLTTTGKAEQLRFFVS